MELHVWMQMSELFAWTLLFFPCPKSGSWDMKKMVLNCSSSKFCKTSAKLFPGLFPFTLLLLLFLPVGSSCTVCSCIVLFSAVYYFPLLIFILIIFGFFLQYIYCFAHRKIYSHRNSNTMDTPPPNNADIQGRKKTKQTSRQTTRD